MKVSFGQSSDKGSKEINQDFCDIFVPTEPRLSNKGVALAIADGISSSKVSQEASEIAIRSFLEDYFCTPDSWTVKTSANRVLKATNSWLYSQNKKNQYHYEKDKGYVCTFSALVVKSNTAHIVHLGDTRIYRLRDGRMEQLTEDHRLWVSQDTSYLSRAMGMDSQPNIDYASFQVHNGDVFLSMTDGVYEYLKKDFIITHIQEHKGDLNELARFFVETAFENGSEDNLTMQILRIDSLPSKGVHEIQQQVDEKPLPPLLDDGQIFDGYKIIRSLSASSRSHVYLAVDMERDAQVVIKIPSIDLQNDRAYLERFLMEEWIAKRINNAHVVRSYAQTREHKYLYNVTEFVEGQTLTQWMIDYPKPSIGEVRQIAEQIAKGLQAFHRLEMVHQDLRPENIIIDKTGTVKIIDFGSTKVEGILDIHAFIEQENLLGTAQYSAPEYFLGESGEARSDIFSLGVIVYQMLSGVLPYGVKVARCTSSDAQKTLTYSSLHHKLEGFPVWFDEALKKALSIDPFQRYGDVFEFIADLKKPNKLYLNKTKPPLAQRDPVAFWQGVCFVLSLVVIVLLLR